MFAHLRFAAVFGAQLCIAVGTTTSAFAITAELAKKCAALTTKAFPPRIPGNPAAGSVKGNGLVEQEYFKRCVANGGNVDDDGSKDQK
jgi:hypothetical protein